MNKVRIKVGRVNLYPWAGGWSIFDRSGFNVFSLEPCSCHRFALYVGPFGVEVEDEPVVDPDEPDGYFIQHNRMTDSVCFGPFASPDDAFDFAEQEGIGCNLRPMWRSVDWNRRC